MDSWIYFEPSGFFLYYPFHGPDLQSTFCDCGFAWPTDGPAAMLPSPTQISQNLLIVNLEPQGPPSSCMACSPTEWGPGLPLTSHLAQGLLLCGDWCWQNISATEKLHLSFLYYSSFRGPTVSFLLLFQSLIKCYLHRELF